MKDMLETPDCPICAANPRDEKCTLHGGYMTATEVQIRGRFAVVDGRWVPCAPLPNPLPEVFARQVDRALEIMRKHRLST